MCLTFAVRRPTPGRWLPIWLISEPRRDVWRNSGSTCSRLASIQRRKCRPFAGHRRPAAVLAQAINHGAEHRAHVCTVLGAHDLQPPALDAFAYCEAVRTRGGRATNAHQRFRELLKRRKTRT